MPNEEKHPSFKRDGGRGSGKAWLFQPTKTPAEPAEPEGKAEETYVRNLPSSTFEPEFQQRVQLRASELERQRRRLRRQRIWELMSVPLVLLAAIALLGLIVYLVTGGGEPSPEEEKWLMYFFIAIVAFYLSQGDTEGVLRGHEGLPATLVMVPAMAVFAIAGAVILFLMGVISSAIWGVVLSGLGLG
jgi:hypothetical protein